MRSINPKNYVYISAITVATIAPSYAQVQQQVSARENTLPLEIIPQRNGEPRRDKEQSIAIPTGPRKSSAVPQVRSRANQRTNDANVQQRRRAPGDTRTKAFALQPQQQPGFAERQEQATATSQVPLTPVGLNTASSDEQKRTKEPVPNDKVSELAQGYCKAMQPSISHNLMEWQRKKLEDLKAEVEQKLKELTARKSDLEAIEQRQQEANSRLTGNVVAILAKMRPDAAASQLAAMEESAAATLITKMDVRSAGVILNEIPASKAARLAELMTGQKNGAAR